MPGVFFSFLMNEVYSARLERIFKNGTLDQCGFRFRKFFYLLNRFVLRYNNKQTDLNDLLTFTGDT